MSIHYYSCINDSPHTLIMELNMQAYFDQLDRVRYEGPKTTNPLAFRHYNPDELVLGKRMEDHLRFAACYWHTFCWNGADMFGNFFSNIGKGNVSGLSIVGLLAAGLMIFGRFGWLGKIGGALLAMMLIGNNSRVAQVQENLQADNRQQGGRHR